MSKITAPPASTWVCRAKVESVVVGHGQSDLVVPVYLSLIGNPMDLKEGDEVWVKIEREANTHLR